MSNKAYIFERDFEWPKIDRQKVRKEHQRRASKWMIENNVDLLMINEPDAVHAYIGQPVMKFYDVVLTTMFLVDTDFNGITVNPFSGEYESPYNYPGVDGISTLFSAGANSYYPELVIEHFVREIKKRGAKKVGIDRPLARVLLGVMEQLPDVEFVDTGWDLRYLRAVKTPEEILEYDIAAQITAVGHAKAMEAVQVGVTDGQLSGIFTHYALAHGAMYPSNLYNLHDTNYEEWGIKDKPMQKGDVIAIDYGLFSPMGLQTDLGRTVWVEGVDPSFRDKYVNYVHAVDSVCRNEIKIGMTKTDIMQRFSKAYKSEGLNDELFMLGHGTGYRISEPPVLDISPIGFKYGEDPVLEEGHIVCLEPAVLENNHGKPTLLQAEDMWVVEKTGLRKLSVGCGYMGIDYFEE